MFLSVCFPVQVSHFTIFFLAYMKVDYETNYFTLTLHVISTRILKSWSHYKQWQVVVAFLQELDHRNNQLMLLTVGTTQRWLS